MKKDDNDIKEKAINEMVFLLRNDCHKATAANCHNHDVMGCDRCGCGLLYDRGYRKIPDGAVVLLVGKDNQALDEKTIAYFVKHNEEVRKQTAKEILQSLYDHCFELVDPYDNDCEESFGAVDPCYILNFAENYGVEVEK